MDQVTQTPSPFHEPISQQPTQSSQPAEQVVPSSNQPVVPSQSQIPVSRPNQTKDKRPSGHFVHFAKYRAYLMAHFTISLLLIAIAVAVVSNRLSVTGRATPGSAGNPSDLSLSNSYVFASPITAEATGQSIIRVIVFLLDSQGLGVAGQKVALKVPTVLAVSQTQPITDTFGRATFDVTSSSPGSYTISAVVGGVSLPQTVGVSFR